MSGMVVWASCVCQSERRTVVVGDATAPGRAGRAGRLVGRDRRPRTGVLLDAVGETAAAHAWIDKIIRRTRLTNGAQRPTGRVRNGKGAEPGRPTCLPMPPVNDERVMQSVAGCHTLSLAPAAEGLLLGDRPSFRACRLWREPQATRLRGSTSADDLDVSPQPDSRCSKGARRCCDAEA
jgi:hypothetical protein